jgi:hypothetical protein
VRSPIIPLFFIAAVLITAMMLALHSVTSNSVSANGKAAPAVAKPGKPAVAQALATATIANTAPVAPADPRTEEPTLEPTETLAPVPPRLKAQIDLIEAQAADMRGLRPLDNLPVAFMTRAQFREEYKKEMQQSFSLDETQLYLQQLWMMRLVPSPNIDYYDVNASLAGDNILGMYDPLKKQMLVITEKPQDLLDPRSQITMAHEYVHSLQDAYYHLAKLWPVGAPDQDRELAVRSLIEGDAELSGFAWAYYYMKRSDFHSMYDQKTLSPGVAKEVPNYMGTREIFPYTAGFDFVNKIMEVGSFSTVNLALQDPPRSTEQIMHPEKFLQVPADQPKSVDLPDLSGPLGKGWDLKETNTLGEFDLNMMLRENGASDPDRGADGWGGGKFEMYKLVNEVIVLSRVVWDTDKDATEFEGAMNETFAKMPTSGPFRVDSGRYFYMTRNGTTVTFVASTNEPALQRVMGAAQEP